MEGNRLDEGERADPGRMRARELQGHDAAVGMRDHMGAGRLVGDERREQPDFLIDSEIVAGRPGIGPPIADEVGRQHAEAVLEDIDDRRPHRSRARRTVQQQNRRAGAGGENGIAQDGTRDGAHAGCNRLDVGASGRMSRVQR